jgi:hypothetical protein
MFHAKTPVKSKVCEQFKPNLSALGVTLRNFTPLQSDHQTVSVIILSQEFKRQVSCSSVQYLVPEYQRLVSW